MIIEIIKVLKELVVKHRLFFLWVIRINKGYDGCPAFFTSNLFHIVKIYS